MICPFPDDMEFAAEWLESYEPADDEQSQDAAKALKHVATWLRNYSRENELRKVAREAGCTVKYARKYLMDNQK